MFLGPCFENSSHKKMYTGTYFIDQNVFSSGFGARNGVIYWSNLA